MAAGIFLSRIAGILRTIALAVVIGGDKAANDAFVFAMRAPNMLQNLLGEGSLSASFIPVYAKLVEDGDEEEASALAGTVLAILALVTAVIVLLLVLLARPLVWLLTSWENDPARYELAIDLFRITTLGIGFLVISAWCLGVLNSHRSFFLSYVAPVVWNLAQIAVLALAAMLAFTTTSATIALAWAVVVGGLLQLLIQIPRVRRFAPSLRTSLTRTPLVDDVIRRFTPAVGARGVVQISSLVDTVFLGMLAGGRPPPTATPYPSTSPRSRCSDSASPPPSWPKCHGAPTRYRHWPTASAPPCVEPSSPPGSSPPPTWPPGRPGPTPCSVGSRDCSIEA